jgi:signal transduction histidine kinase/HAMP domain-containing protein/ActR/RegA family two-component response regulator
MSQHSLGLRARTTVLLMGGALIVGLGFEVLLTSLVHHREYSELEARARSLARILAERSVTPVVVDDQAELRRQVHRTITETDVVGAAVYSGRGTSLARRSRDPALWPQMGPLGMDVGSSVPRAWRRHTPSGEVLDVIAPIQRSAGRGGAVGDASQLFGLTEPATERADEPLGWVRLAVSTERARQSVAEAARLGLLLLLLGLGLGVIAVWISVGLVIRPLREARDLAREIASGQLERRLPVRSRDELGDLAGSMNTMAAALQVARARAENEAAALRTASSAMLSIARGARAAHDADSIFGMVAQELRRVTRARSVALAVPPAGQGSPVFERFDGAQPWTTLRVGSPVPEWLLEPVRGLGDGALRLSIPDDPREELSRAGFRAALVVPLQLPNSPPALLVAGSEDPNAFPESERDIVVAMASHLSSALHAGRLEARLDGAFAELQRTHDYLVQSEMLRVAGEMASGVAHDFNNVLGAILGRTQLVRRSFELGTMSSEELLTSLAVIEQAAQDGRETGRRLRQFGHVPQSAAAEPVDLHEMLRDAIEFTRPRWSNEAQAAGISIEVRLMSQPGAWVAGRGNELREVFTNLLLNAVDALPRGGTIEASTFIEDGRVVATVADDGVGMDEETARRIFEPFFTTKGEGGTGLGLAVVYGIVQRGGGDAQVRSVPGRGTMLRLSFPLVGHSEAEPAAEVEPEALPALDVMVVDDEDSVREVLRDIAGACGQRVTAFGSGHDALRDLKAGDFQLVLTDLGMPSMTGWELARRVRAIDPQVTIVFVTGWGEDVDRRAAGEAGADMVLAKPFSFEDVSRAIALAAERAGAQRIAA